MKSRDLSRVRDREKLKPKAEPYWQRVAQGKYLGFRPSKAGKGGNWIARYYMEDLRSNTFNSLGDFGDLAENERHRAALKSANEWFDHLDSGGTKQPVTVREACEQYAVEHPSEIKRFERIVYNDPIATIRLDKLTIRQVTEWRKRLEKKPALVTRKKPGQPQVTRQRSDSTVNRDMVPLRAALNQAHRFGHITSDSPWKAALTPSTTTTSRDLYLDKNERSQLLANLDGEIAHFAKAMCLLPIRPGALAKLKVGDFDVKQGTLRVQLDKAGKGRVLMLPDATSRFIGSRCKNKKATDHVFHREDGKPWSKDMWKKPIKKAAAEANLPSATAMYTLRHSIITDLVSGGTADLLTIARLAGTSVAMIEKHYGHLRQQHATKALAQLTV